MVTTISCYHHCTFLVYGKKIIAINLQLYKNFTSYVWSFQVIKSQLTGSDFVWLFPGWYVPGWWNVSDGECTATEMRNGLEHSLTYGSNSVVTTNPSRVIVSGKVTYKVNI